MIPRSPLVRIAAALTATLIALPLEISGSTTPVALQVEAQSPRSSARAIVETSSQITARPVLVRPVMLAYERLSLAKHRVSLVLSSADSVEWGLTVTHIPSPGVTVVGASVHFPLRPEISAVMEVSEALVTDTMLSAPPTETLWGVGLEWKRIVDPLAISAAIVYSSSALGAFADVSINGSVSVLLTDTISLSLSAPVSGICQDSLSPAFGISLANRKAPKCTLYTRIDASLAPADSVCLSIGVVRKLE